MLKNNTSTKYSCQIQDMMKLLGKKWSLLILKCISKNNALSFTQLKKELKISQKILWQRLEELEQEGIIANISLTKSAKNIYQGSDDYRSLYELTSKGEEVEKFLTLFEEVKQ